MPLRLRSAGGGSVLLKPPVALAADVSMEVPGYEGAKLLTNKTPGTLLQVVQVAKTSTSAAAIAANVYGEFDTSFRLVITPSSASNKILLSSFINAAQNTGTIRYLFQFSTDNGATWANCSPVGDANASHGVAHSGFAVNSDTNQVVTTGFEFLHSPNTTNTVIYRVLFGADIATTYYFNRSISYSNNFLGATYTSTMVAKEIAA